MRLEPRAPAATERALADASRGDSLQVQDAPLALLLQLAAPRLLERPPLRRARVRVRVLRRAVGVDGPLLG